MAPLTWLTTMATTRRPSSHSALGLGLGVAPGEGKGHVAYDDGDFYEASVKPHTVCGELRVACAMEEGGSAPCVRYRR